MPATASRPSRAEVATDRTWNLADLYPTDDAWEADVVRAREELPSVTAFAGRLGEGAATIADCLNARDALIERFTRVATYASLRQSEDGTSPANQQKAARVAMLSAEGGAALTFIDSELLALPNLNDLIADPVLAVFDRYLTDLAERQPHMLSPATELAIASLEEVLDAPYTVYSMSKAADMRFGTIHDGNGDPVPLSFALYEDRFEDSADTVTRRRAYDAFAAGLTIYQNTYAATLATEVTKHVVLAKLRGYESAEHLLLAPQHIPYEVYSNLVTVIQRDLAPHFRRYMRLRKRILGLDELRYCDIKAPLDPEYRPEISFPDAQTLIADGLAVFGEEHNAIMRQAMRDRWVDLPDNIGKSTGAFCSSPYGVHSFILITWTDSMRSAFVLAHELGHAGHFTLAQRDQRLINTRPSMFFIETPSTLNELVLADSMLRTSTDPRLRRWVIMQLLATYHHNFITHLLEAELQRRLFAHAGAGRPITASVLNTEKGDILERFWGDTVRIDDAARLTWMRQPHYYLGLYPYTYSAGLTASTAIAAAIRQEGQPAVDRWIAALKAGGTLRPLDLMRLAGVDFSTTAPIDTAVAYVGSLIDELEASFAESV